MAVIDAEGIPFKRHAADLAYSLPGNLAERIPMDVPRNQIEVAVRDPDEVEVTVAADGAGSLEQAAARGALEHAFDGVASYRVDRLHLFGVLVNPTMRSLSFRCEMAWDRPVD